MASPRQKVHQAIDFKVRFVDLTAEPQIQESAIKRLRDVSMEPFDFENGPLLRIFLLKLSEMQHVMSFTIHHIISDGWSIDIMMQEFGQLYNLLYRGEEVSLPPLRIQYRDYIHWQDRLLVSEAMALHWKYWHEKLSGEIPVLDLPTDFPRPSMPTFNGDAVSMSLSPEQTEKLNLFSKTQKTSRFVTLLAMLKVLFYCYTGQEDIIVGSPVAGRNHLDLENQIGFYINMLVLRDMVRDSVTFEFFLQQVKQTVTEALEHQNYPFDRLVDELNLPRDFSRSPLFDVMVNLLPSKSSNLEMTGLIVSPFINETFTNLFDINFMFKEMEGVFKPGFNTTPICLNASRLKIWRPTMSCYWKQSSINLLY